MTIDSSGPEWWLEALRLERADRLTEAEAVIEKAVNCIGASAQVAEMYRLRMLRMLEAGNRGEAIEAFRASNESMRFYASQATSGGEGAALSLERDDHRKQLVRELGFDPGDEA